MRLWWLTAVACCACGAPEEAEVEWWGPTIFRSADDFFVVERVFAPVPAIHVIWARTADEPSRPITSLEGRRHEYFLLPAGDYCAPVMVWLRPTTGSSTGLEPWPVDLRLKTQETSWLACRNGTDQPWLCSLECYGTPWLLELERP